MELILTLKPGFQEATLDSKRTYCNCKIRYHDFFSIWITSLTLSRIHVSTVWNQQNGVAARLLLLGMQSIQKEKEGRCPGKKRSPNTKAPIM